MLIVTRISCVWLLSLMLLLTSVSPARANTLAASPQKHPDLLAGAALTIRSWENDGLFGAEVSGRLDQPLPRVRDALSRPEAWCEFLPLVFNIKSCTYSQADGRQQLTVYIGRKFYERPEEAYRLGYRFQVQEVGADRLKVLLFAAAGPHGTGDYRITVEARREGDGRTRLRMDSSFRPSLRSRLATQAYLATSGRDKIGFSVKETIDGEPIYVSGINGIVERNAMRYYLALKAYFDTLALPETRRFDARLVAWYEMTEKYPQQLFEMPKEEYLAGKRQERQNQFALQRRGHTGRSG